MAGSHSLRSFRGRASVVARVHRLPILVTVLVHQIVIVNVSVRIPSLGIRLLLPTTLIADRTVMRVAMPLTWAARLSAVLTVAVLIGWGRSIAIVFVHATPPVISGARAMPHLFRRKEALTCNE